MLVNLCSSVPLNVESYEHNVLMYKCVLPRMVSEGITMTDNPVLLCKTVVDYREIGESNKCIFTPKI